MIIVDARIQAAFDESLANYRAALRGISAELSERQAQLAAHETQRREQAQARAAELVAAVESKRKDTPKVQQTWPGRDDRRTVLSFGAESDPAPAQPPARPVPVPPVPVPVPPVAEAPQHYLSLGQQEDEAEPPRGRTRPPRPVAEEPDDDDFSGHSWIRR